LQESSIFKTTFTGKTTDIVITPHCVYTSAGEHFLTVRIDHSVIIQKQKCLSDEKLKSVYTNMKY